MFQAKQEVPDWLQKEAENSGDYGGDGNGYDQGGFGGKDVRGLESAHIPQTIESEEVW